MFLSPKNNVLEFGFMSGQAIADLGAGSGHYALALAKILGPKAHIYAVDIQEEPLVRLKNMALAEGLRNVDVICGDIEKPRGTHLRNELVDGVVMSNILFQLEDKEAGIAEASRILKTKGRCAVVEWSDKFSKAEARKLFESKGFSFERGFDAGDHHYILIFERVV